MRIGVVSDTHGNHKILRHIAEKGMDVDQWIHAGDYGRDGRLLTEITGAPLIAVRGNCDGTTDDPLEQFLEVGGRLIWITHGHKFYVKHGTRELESFAESYGADIVVYGHSHVPEVKWMDGRMFINPGSAAFPKDYEPATWGIIVIKEDGSFDGEILTLE